MIFTQSAYAMRKLQIMKSDVHEQRINARVTTWIYFMYVCTYVYVRNVCDVCRTRKYVHV